MDAFGEELEVVDQLFHVGLHVHARGRCHLVVLGDHRARVAAQPVHALLDDPVRLAHLFHAHQVARVAVAAVADGDVEVELVVHLVGLLLAQVPLDARAAQHRAGKAHLQRTFRADHADVHQALLPDTVIGQQRLIFIHVRRKTVREVFDEVQQRARTGFVHHLDGTLVVDLRSTILRHRVRQVAVDAARTVVGRVHARARHRLVHVEQVFALAEGVQEHRHRAHVECVRTDPHQVVHDAGDLVEHHTDVLRADRHFQAQQALDRHHVGVLVGHHRHVVESVHVGHALDPGLLLGQLLGGTVQQADMRVGALDDFAVQLEHQAQHAVRRRVLRAEVQGVILDICHDVDLSAARRRSFPRESREA
ncbi:hypothetical protein D3C72_1283360 [compost metagenome]